MFEDPKINQLVINVLGTIFLGGIISWILQDITWQGIMMFILTGIVLGRNNKK